MKRKNESTLLLVILIFALLTVSCSQSTAAVSPRNLSAASFSMQVTTPTPPVEDQSEIGSTNGILLMGIVIVVITSLPLLLRRKKK